MKNVSIFKKIMIRGLLTGTFFISIWGLWAYYINLVHGVNIAMRAAFTQGTFTMVNTFIYTVVMEYMFSISKTKFNRFLMAFLLPNILSTIALIYIHSLRGTPNIIKTIVPVLSIMYLLSLIYLLLIGPKQFSK